MSNPKYTPMQILRDNINVRIKNETDLSALQELFAILEMIEGDSLGKPLLEQEAELLGIEKEIEEDREPQVGDMVFAWSNEGEPPTYGELIRFSNTESCINPLSSHLEHYKYCSLKNPLVK